MCGIAGIFNLSGELINASTLKEMMSTIRHRGPDDEGFYLDGAIGLGHCRLSIIDLSSTGHQPMSNEDETVWLVFNGEIYNFRSLREDLKVKGHSFRSSTDSEVIIHAYEQYGIECLSRFNGMWAFALWDRKKQRFFCARDRLGVKPFYYNFDSRRFLFASEIKALLQDKSSKKEPNDQIIWDYLVKGYVDHTEDTFFSDIKQLLPAHYLFIENKELSIYRYWDLDPNITLSNITDAEAARRFYELFEDSIRLHLQSDVPLGTCLSGGLDSSSIVCMTSKLLFNNGLTSNELISQQQKTFSSCFEDKQFDERDFIKEVVEQTKVDARYVFPDGTDLLDSMDTMIWHQDEPFPSVRLFSQWHVMKLAKENGITVLLDGQGADELLAGYHFFFLKHFESLLRKLQFKRLIGEVKSYSRLHSQPTLPIVKDLLRFVIPRRILNLRKYVLNRVGKREEPYPWLNKDYSRKHENNTTYSPTVFSDSLKLAMYNYLSKYRLPSLLRYEDRNSMAFSLEARVPFLDHRLVEFVFSLPNTQIMRNGVTKFVLRKAMEELIPEKIQKRTDKMGFVVPEDYWLQKLNKEQILDIFTSRSFSERGYFNHPQLLKSYELYCTGHGNVDSSLVWRWVNLELWLRKFIDKIDFNEDSVN